jgi:hypothetical protein
VQKSVKALRRSSFEIARLEARRLLATVSWDGGGDGVHWDDANNWTGNVAPVAGDDVVVDVPGSASTVIRFITPQFNSLLNRETIAVQSSNLGGGVNLQVGLGGINNFGTIEVNTVENTWTAGIDVTGPISNAAGSVLRVLVGAGGYRFINTNSLTNAGTITASTLVDINTATLTNSGALSSTGRLAIVNSVATYNNGTTFTGNVYQRTGSVNVVGTTVTGTLQLEGSVDFIGNASTGTTLWVQGNAGQSRRDSTGVDRLDLGVIRRNSTRCRADQRLDRRRPIHPRRRRLALDQRHRHQPRPD